RRLGTHRRSILIGALHAFNLGEHKDDIIPAFIARDAPPYTIRFLFARAFDRANKLVTEYVGGQVADSAEDAFAFAAEDVANEGNNAGESVGHCGNKLLDHNVILSK